MLRKAALVVALLPIACEQAPTRPSPNASAAPSSVASAAPAAPAELTAARLVKASALVKKGDDWKKASDALAAELGPATHTGNYRLVWGIATPDDCSYLMIQESSGSVSDVTPAATYPRSKTAEFEDCYLYLDRTPPDKDSTAPAPEPGKVYSVREVLEGIDNARSKWLGKKVQVRGRVLSVVRSGPTGEATLASMNVADEKDDASRIGVQIRQDVKRAPRDGQKVVVTAEGTVAAMGRSIDDARIVK